MSQVITTEGTLTNGTDTVVSGMLGQGGASIQVYGTWTGTIAFDGAVQGATFQALSTTTLNGVTTGTTTTANGIFVASVPGLTAVRVRFSSYSSGTAFVLIQSVEPSPGWPGGSGGGGGGTSSAFGSAFPAAGTAAGFIGSDGNMTGGLLDADGFLKVNVAAGGTGGGTVDQGTGGLSAWLVTGTGGTFPVTDSGGSLTVDGSVTVTQGTATNLKAQAEVYQGGSAVGAANPLQVSLANTAANATAVKVDGSAATQPVSGTVTANQGGTWTVQPGNTANTTAWKVDGSAVTQPVSGTFWQATQPVSAASLPLPTGASTLAEQQSQTTSLQLLDDVVATTASAIPSKGYAVSGTDGTNARVLKTDTSGELQVDVLTLPANASVNVAQVGGTNSVTAGVNGTLAVGGNVATNVAIGTNPVNLGAQAVSAENTAVTATRMVQLVADLAGKLIVLPYANPENFVSGCITSAMTGTTSTSLIAAPAGSLRNYITQITVSNTHATVGTNIEIQDGSGGTTFYIIPAAAVYGGATLTFPTPLRQPTAATALYCKNTTTGASTFVSASGYKGV